MIAVRRAGIVAAAVVAVGVLTGAPAAPAASAAAPAHVAIVVAGVGSACVPWHSGMTGADVLDAAYTVTYGQQTPYIGFVLTINGIGTTRPSNNTYWAYYHDTGSGWSYSTSGAFGYHPAAGTVEGWAYDNGQNPAPTPPAASYAAICAGQDPTVAPPATSTPVRPASPPRSTGVSTPTMHSAVVAATSSVAPGATSSSFGSRAETPTTADAAAAPASGTPTPSPSLVSTVTGPLVAHHVPAHHSSPLGVIIAAVVLGGLAAGIVWRARRGQPGSSS